MVHGPDLSPMSGAHMSGRLEVKKAGDIHLLSGIRVSENPQKNGEANRERTVHAGRDPHELSNCGLRMSGAVAVAAVGQSGHDQQAVVPHFDPIGGTSNRFLPQRHSSHVVVRMSDMASLFPQVGIVGWNHHMLAHLQLEEDSGVVRLVDTELVGDHELNQQRKVVRTADYT